MLMALVEGSIHSDRSHANRPQETWSDDRTCNRGYVAGRATAAWRFLNASQHQRCDRRTAQCAPGVGCPEQASRGLFSPESPNPARKS